MTFCEKKIAKKISKRQGKFSYFSRKSGIWNHNTWISAKNSFPGWCRDFCQLEESRYSCSDSRNAVWWYWPPYFHYFSCYSRFWSLRIFITGIPIHHWISTFTSNRTNLRRLFIQKSIYDLKGERPIQCSVCTVSKLIIFLSLKFYVKSIVSGKVWLELILRKI